MSSLFASSFFPLFTIAAFIAVVLFLEAVYLIWDSYKSPEAKKIGQRLRALSGFTISFRSACDVGHEKREHAKC